MALTAFTCRLGDGQGRLATPLAPTGDFAFVLGDIEPARYFSFVPGDHADVTQSVDLTGVTLVRATFRFRGPASIPAGLAWEASILVDGAAAARTRARAGRTRLITDLGANVSKLAGLHTVGARLALVVA